MRIVYLVVISLLCAITLSTAYGLIGEEGTNFSSDGYLTTISINYDGARTLGIVEGNGGGGGYPTLNSELTVKVYDNTTDYPYVELYDNDVLIEGFRMYEKEVAKIWVTGDNGNETMILITDMRGSRSAWIDLVDYTCTGNEAISPFNIYNENGGLPDALIFTWLDGCEQLVVPLYQDSHSFFGSMANGAKFI